MSNTNTKIEDDKAKAKADADAKVKADADAKAKADAKVKADADAKVKADADAKAKADAKVKADVKDDEKEFVNPTANRQLKAKKLRNKLIKDLAEKEENAEETTILFKKEVKKDRPFFTDDRGVRFQFKKQTPLKLNIDGVSLNISDIIKDEALMLELTSGNNNYIEQIY